MIPICKRRGSGTYVKDQQCGARQELKAPRGGTFTPDTQRYHFWGIHFCLYSGRYWLYLILERGEEGKVIGIITLTFYNKRLNFVTK